MGKSKSSTMYWLFGGIILTITGLLAFTNLEEWYVISILGRTAGYPFGGEGPTAYYYKTPELYALVSLTWGLIFTGTFAFTLVTIIKKKKERMVAAFGTTVFLLAVLFIHGLIE
ncbi:hypothetical protein [Pontibacter mangrovi]|uniref:Uncharacterized protein n=1 Tax=Pontibacter mangrovi TaxID=2589816 RepID=A0A501W724_9BACT|nr:hypothetical protein [Pontibacter mangrovi]TPE42627.1 hypothetical protein FJM65_17595 [Pontibacter mangrovi]